METLQENILNVTLIEPRLKHPTIFQHFDALQEGEEMTLLNDHDPKPLYYQLLGERGDIFTWEYLEQGPEWWKIHISKKVTGEGKETLGEIAAKDLRKAEIFKKYGLDFCCNGNRTIKQACEEKGLDVAEVERELQQADKAPVTAQPLPFNDWGLDFLADYIVNTHHLYVRKNMNDLRGYAAKIATVHGKQHSELLTIQKLVNEVLDELSSHMVKEENVLFPYIKSLVAVKNNQQPLQSLTLNTVEDPIAMMEHEHQLVGDNMAKIRQLSDNYTLPADACSSYALYFKMLKDLESDLFTHIHLENNILFKKAIKMEKELKK